MNPYLELLKKSVNNYLYLGTDSAACDERYYDEARWKVPRASQPHTLCNRSQLDFLERLMANLLRNRVDGDFLEAGVWRGGACIFMRGFLAAHSDARNVWLLDTFDGIPHSSGEAAYRDDEVDDWTDRWSAGLVEVREHFSRYDLLDEQVRFLPGRIGQTLAANPIKEVALARLDVDSYESYSEALESIYPLMCNGGCIVLDDWHLEPCRAAVNDFRKARGIHDPILEDFMGAWADAHWFVRR